MHLRLSFIILLFIAQSAIACEITMGYRTSERLPLISKSPDNEGLYLALYSKALSDIGCKLEVIRAPKKRILHMLEEGEIDFYPGLGRSPDRDKYLYYIDSGLRNSSGILSHVDEKTIHKLSEMKGKTLLFSKGSRPIDGEKHGIIMRRAHDLSIETAINVIAKKQADFYIYDKNSMLYYLKIHPNNSVKVQDFNSELSPILLGFSKKSPFAQSYPEYLKIIQNNKYQNKPFLPVNKVYEFKQSLIKLQNEGFTDNLFNRFYKI